MYLFINIYIYTYTRWLHWLNDICVNCDYLVASKKFRVICKDGIAGTAQPENKRKLEKKKNWPFGTSLAYTSVQAKGSLTPRAPQTLASIPV